MTQTSAHILTAAQIGEYSRQGYLVVEDFASATEVAALRQRAEQLVDKFDAASVASVFSTKNQTSKTDQYFLDSASNVSFFFEEEAFGAGGSLRQAKALSINKIGHALHDLDPVFRAFSRSPRVAALVRQLLGFKRPLPVQSMYIFKQPKIGGEVVPHQDSSFLATSPPSATGLWLALEPATVDNGCLWTLPAPPVDHVARHFLRSADGSVSFDAPAPAYDLDAFVPLEVPAGALVVLHGSNVHFSRPNRSPDSRHAYTMHVVDGDAVWEPHNWMQRRSDLPFEPLYVDGAASC